MCRTFDKHFGLFFAAKSKLDRKIQYHKNRTFLFLFVCLFVLLLYVPVNSYGHYEMVSSPKHTFSWTSIEQAVNQYFEHILSLVTDNDPSWMFHSAEGRRMTVEIISWSISTKVWDRSGIELRTPRFAVRHTSVARHVTDCPTRPGVSFFVWKYEFSLFSI